MFEPINTWVKKFVTRVLFIKSGLLCHNVAVFFWINKQSFGLSSGEGWSSCSDEAILQPGSSVFTLSRPMDWLPPCRCTRFAQSSHLHGTFFTILSSFYSFSRLIVWLNPFNCIRPMRMGRQQCRFTREKPVLKISMVMFIQVFLCNKLVWYPLMMLMGFPLLWNSCDISLAVAIRKRYHRHRWPQTERGMQSTVQKQRGDRKSKALRDWHGERRRVRYMYGDEQHGCSAQLYTLFMHQVLPWLVRRPFFIEWVSSRHGSIIITRCFCCRHGRSESCPFCRDSLKRVNSGDLWMLMERSDTVSLHTVERENKKRLFVYIEKLPLVVPDQVFASSPYDCHVKWIIRRAKTGSGKLLYECIKCFRVVVSK